MVQLKKLLLFLPFWVVLIGGFNSCKKGCTNPDALNFNVKAKEDDGSCLSCDTFQTWTSPSLTEWTDYNSASQYYSRVVMRSEVHTTAYEYTGNGCDLIGINTTCSSPTGKFANAEITFISHISDTILFNANAYIITGFTDSFDIILSDIVIPPHSRVTLPHTYYISCLNSTAAFVNSRPDERSFQYR